jgi:hypothetical protein
MMQAAAAEQAHFKSIRNFLLANRAVFADFRAD